RALQLPQASRPYSMKISLSPAFAAVCASASFVDHESVPPSLKCGCATSFGGSPATANAATAASDAAARANERTFIGVPPAWTCRRVSGVGRPPPAEKFRGFMGGVSHVAVRLPFATYGRRDLVIATILCLGGGVACAL